MVKKTSFGPDFSPFGANSDCQFFFSKIWLSGIKCYGQLSSCTIPEKTNDPILGKLSDTLTDTRTDGQE